MTALNYLVFTVVALTVSASIMTPTLAMLASVITTLPTLIH